jgi:NAD(P)H-hydrate epimerase
MLPVLPERARDAHKGNFGHVLVVGGSPGMTGAARMAAESAQLAGAGLTTLALPAGLGPVGEMGRASIMSMSLPDTPEHALGLRAALAVLASADKFDVCALGPGLGRGPATRAMVRRLVGELELPLVLDADGLNALAGDLSPLDQRRAPIVLTPHPGEMARLTAAASSAQIQADRKGTALRFARKHDCVTVLKGRGTVVTDGDRCCINETGNPGMAVGGMGDVLTGLIAGLLAQGMVGFEAARLGTFVHGLSGDLGGELEGEASLSPEFLMECVPEVLTEMDSVREAGGGTVDPQRVRGTVLGL